MSETPRLKLPYIAQSQAQKEVTNAMGLDILDAIVQAAVKDRDLATPPGSPATGDSYIVAASPSGAWVGHATHIAQWISVQWKFSVPLEGWLAYVQDEDLYVSFNGTAWQVFSSGAGSNFLALSDTPDSYTGQGGKVVAVNAGATALEFTSPSAGVSTFTALTDTPDTYTGQAGQFVKVNAGATALEFGAGSTGTFLNLSDTPDTYSGHNGQVVSVKSDSTGLEFLTPAGGTLGLHRGALLELATTQAIPDVTATLIPWGTVVYDTNSVWSASQPTRFTVPAGMDKVMVQAQLEMTSAGTGGLSLRLLKNGTTVAGQAAMRQPIESSAIPAPSVILSVMTPPLAVTAGDYFELEVLQNSGTALAAVAGQTSWMTMVLISPATAGATTFLALADTPDTYTGQAGKAVLVNAGATALEFGTPGAGTFLALSDTPDAYTGQGGKVVAVKSDTTGLEFITGGGGGAALGATVQRVATQNIVQNTNVAISFDTETRDDAAFWAVGSPTRLTIPSAGWYTITAFVQWDTTSGVTRIVNVRVNGTQYIAVESTGNAGVDQRQTVAVDWYLQAADYVEIVVFQSTAGARTITGNASIVGVTAAPAPATTFLALTDTPDAYTGQGGNLVTVNSGATALDYTPLTAAGRALLDDADAAAQRATLGLGTLAQQNAASVAITGGSATGLTTMGIGTPTPSQPLTVNGQSWLLGHVGVVAEPQSGAVVYVYQNKTAEYGLWIHPYGSDTGPNPAVTFTNVAGSVIGSITTSASATAYNTSSDARLKTAVAPLTGALDVLRRLRPVTHLWRADGSRGYGFLAHEVQETIPDGGIVTGERDAVDDAGQIVPQQMDQGKLVPWLTAALQEALAALDTLTARVQALEARAQA